MKVEQQQMKINQQQMKIEQTKIHCEIINTMQKILKNPSSIDKKGDNRINNMVISKKASTFPKIPTTINETNLSQWYDEILARLMATPWDVNGTSILDMPHVRNIAEASKAYRI